MSLSQWEHSFKSEIRTSGQAFVAKGKVNFSQPSETEVQCYIRASSSFKVIVKTDSIGSDTLTVDCTCPSSKKNQLCKHVWAALLTINIKNPDFLEEKIKLEKKSTPLFETVSKTSQIWLDSQAAFKQKQAEYRKEQYQKQKQRIKDRKNTHQKDRHLVPDFPPSVELALNYFSENGFVLRETLNKASLGVATRKLARIFHPDVGGSHNEILELNKFAEILEKYAKS
jgi:hypothetical protein